MENVIIVAVLLCIVTGIVFYIYKQKKKGHTCIGCPYAKECSKKNCESKKENN